MPVHLPALSVQQTSFANALAARLTPLSLTLGGIDGVLSWQLRGQRFEPALALDLSLDGVPAEVLLETDPLGSLLNMPVAGADFQRLPQAFQAGVLESMLADLIEQYTTASGMAIEARALRHPNGIQQSAVGAQAIDLHWRFAAQDGGQQIAGLLRLAPQTAQRIADRFASQAPGPTALAVDDLPIAPFIVLGSGLLTKREIAAIELGDVVVVLNHQWDRSLVTVTITDEVRYVARIDDGALAVVAREGADLVDEYDDEAIEDSAPTNVDALALPVSFDLGRLELSVGELGQIAEGYLFTLQKPLDGPVAIRVNGRLIGRGELVDIEGSLGVRVTEVLVTSNG